MRIEKTRVPDDWAVRKPDGCFSFISVMQLAMVWWAYDSGRIRFVDLRCYFACWELLARRQKLERGRSPNYGPREVHELTGGAGGEHTRHALRRLSNAGLLAFTATSVRFAVSPDGMSGDLTEFWELLSKIENNRRKVPVPRRVVRFLAGGAGRVTTAVVLGHLLRCMYYRDGLCKPLGNCKASWLASVFGVNTSNVKASRIHLARIGLFFPIEMPQWHRNRWGARIAINMQWEGDAAVETETAATSELRPPSGLSTTESRPLCLNQNPLPEREFKNQNPGRSNPTGFSARKGNEPETSQPPNIRHIVSSDLSSSPRLLELHRQAVRTGLADASEHGLLQFVALAEHARVYATKDPCGLFISNLKNRRYGFINQTDEDRANRRIKEHFFPVNDGGLENPQVQGPEPRSAPKPLTELAKLVLAVERVVRTLRSPVDAFHVARQHRPELTHQQWERGRAEIEARRFHDARTPHARP